MFFSNLSLEKAGSLSKKTRKKKNLPGKFPGKVLGILNTEKQHCCIIKLDKKEIEFKAPEKCVPACVCRP